MAVATFLRPHTLNGRTLQAGDTTQVPDEEVYGLLRKGLITCPGVYHPAYELFVLAGGFEREGVVVRYEAA